MMNNFLLSARLTPPVTFSPFEEAFQNASFVQFFFEKILEPLDKKYSSALFKDEDPVLENEINFDRWSDNILQLCQWLYKALDTDGETQWENLKKIQTEFKLLTLLKLRMNRQSVHVPEEFINAIKKISVMAMLIALILEAILDEVENNKRLQEKLYCELPIDEALDPIANMYESPEKKLLESREAVVQKAIHDCSVAISAFELQLEKEPSLEKALVRQVEIEQVTLNQLKIELSSIMSEANLNNLDRESKTRVEQKRSKIKNDNLQTAINNQSAQFQNSRIKGVELIKNNLDLLMGIHFSEFVIQAELASTSAAMIEEYLESYVSDMKDDLKRLLSTYNEPSIRNLTLMSARNEKGDISHLVLRDNSHTPMIYHLSVDILSASIKLDEPSNLERFGEHILTAESPLAQQSVNIIQEHSERQKAIRSLKIDLDEVLRQFLLTTNDSDPAYQQGVLKKRNIAEQLFLLDNEDKSISAQIFFIKHAIQKALIKRGVFNDHTLEKKKLEQFGFDSQRIVYLSGVNFLLKLHYLEENITAKIKIPAPEKNKKNTLSQLIPGILVIIRNLMKNLSLLPEMVDRYFSQADSRSFIASIGRTSPEKKVQLALNFVIVVLSRLLENIKLQLEIEIENAKQANMNIALFDDDIECFEQLIYFFSDLQAEITVPLGGIRENFLFILGSDFLMHHEEALLDGSCIKARGIELCEDAHFLQQSVKCDDFEITFKTSPEMIGFLKLPKEMRKRLVEHSRSHTVINSVVTAHATKHQLHHLLIKDYLHQWHAHQMRLSILEASKNMAEVIVEPKKISAQIVDQEDQRPQPSFILRKLRTLFSRPNSAMQEDEASSDSDECMTKELDNIECNNNGEYEMIAISDNHSTVQYWSLGPNKLSFYKLVNQAYLNKISENTIDNLVVHGQPSQGTMRALSQLLKAEEICKADLGEEYSILALRGLYYLLYIVASGRFSKVFSQVVIRQWGDDLSEIKNTYNETILNAQEMISDDANIPEVLPVLLALQEAVLTFHKVSLIIPGLQHSELFFSEKQMSHLCQGNWYLKLRFIQEAINVPSDQRFIVGQIKVIQNAFDHLLNLSSFILNYFEATDSKEVYNIIFTMLDYQRIKLALMMLVSFLHIEVTMLHAHLGVCSQTFDIAWLPKLANFFEDIMQEARFIYDKKYQGTLFELVKMFLIAVKHDSRYLLLEGTSFRVQTLVQGSEINVSDDAAPQKARSMSTVPPIHMSSFYYNRGSIRLSENTFDRRADKGTKALVHAILKNPVEDALTEAQIRHYSSIASPKVNF